MGKLLLHPNRKGPNGLPAPPLSPKRIIIVKLHDHWFNSNDKLFFISDGRVPMTMSGNLKAAKRVALLVGVFLVCWLSYIIIGESYLLFGDRQLREIHSCIKLVKRTWGDKGISPNS